MKYFLLLVLLILKISHAEAADHFSTRLNSNLLIAAQACEGDEVVASPVLVKWTEYKCVPGEWLLIVDNVNTCSENGLCTEASIMPITAKLLRTGYNEDGGYETYKILPSIPVSPEQRWILRSHKVHVHSNNEAVVVRN